ncbi:MAG: hypothetical protein ACPL3A_09325 [Thermoanaerobacteraceae bacterium]
MNSLEYLIEFAEIKNIEYKNTLAILSIIDLLIEKNIITKKELVNKSEQIKKNSQIKTAQ